MRSAAGSEGEGLDPGPVDHHGLFLGGGLAEFARGGIGGFQLGDPATYGFKGSAPALELLVAVFVQRVGVHGGIQQVNYARF